MFKSRCPEANIHSSFPDFGQVSLATLMVSEDVASDLKQIKIITRNLYGAFFDN